MNRRIVLRQRPDGLLDWDDVELENAPIPEPAEGEAVLRAEYLGMDATVRSWLDDGDGYLPAVQIGEVVRCASIGRVVSTRCDAYAVGDLVAGLTGWQEYGIVRDDVFANAHPPGTDPLSILSVYGSAGMTAYVGMVDVGAAREGETVVVSAAAGATGSLAGQIAKALGCRVIGIVGTDDKCRFVIEELGFDGAINHRTADLRAELRAHCRRGVDVYFDNVGGPVLDAVLARLAHGGRVVLCGAISSYNDPVRPPGPANYLNLISRRGRMEGFIALDHWGRYDEITERLRAWVEDGRLRYVIDEFEGLESCVDALNALFTGANTGKVVVKL